MFHIRGAVLERIGSPRPYVESRPIGVADLDLEAPGSDEVLVRIEAAGVCHSDLSVVNGNRVRPVPMLLGHEAAGIVEQAGDRVDDVAVGQRVVLVFLPRCEHCAACATEGMTPCQPAGAANAAGTLLGGAIRLSRKVIRFTTTSGSRDLPPTPWSTGPAPSRYPTMFRRTWRPCSDARC
ncbi:alcohol dehydrogenase GroES-like domain protein [Mycobacterium kansasii 662]|uniref:Alcohol dehydrogenase GroES-like domain protein n=1 Tax=Mycobacterium kansasii 662 TaxID=1299326 RepID=X7Z234_MYCKA|nr:alcohol dehydrogenase GroES-like domain protein [Mycobacterium kansasii 662]